MEILYIICFIVVVNICFLGLKYYQYKQGGATKDLSISRVEEQQKEIEKLKAVIEYLESKLK